MKNMEKKSIISVFAVIIAFVLVICVVGPSVKESKVKAENEVEIQALSETPAAEYCQNNGGTLQVKMDELAGAYGICIFNDGSTCEILKYFRGECLSASEQEDDEDFYCSDLLACEDEEAEGLSSWVENINNMGYMDEEVLSGDDLSEMDIDSLYDYYENEFSTTGNKNREKTIGEFNGGENMEDSLLASCDRVGGTILGDKCYLSNGIEITF